MVNTPTIQELIDARVLAIARVDAAVDAYMAGPTVEPFTLGNGYELNLCMAVETHPYAQHVVQWSDVSEALKRAAIRKAVFSAQPTKVVAAPSSPDDSPPPTRARTSRTPLRKRREPHVAQGGTGVDGHVVSLRVMLRADTLLGPGKAALLQAIRETGSISAAGRLVGMSYKRAWYLIDTLNGAFLEPLVTANKGGNTGGEARLTSTGAAILDGYRRMEAAATDAVAGELRQLVALMNSTAS